MADFKLVGVTLPNSVVKIIESAGGTDPKRGGMPMAMASIVGALPWIAVSLFESMPREEYDAFAKQLKENMQVVWAIAGHENPRQKFDEMLQRMRKVVN